MANIGIIGAGSWGTALGILLVNNGHNTTLWSHREEQARELAKTREHKEKLPGVRLPEASGHYRGSGKDTGWKRHTYHGGPPCGCAADRQKDQAVYPVWTADRKCVEGY